MKLIGQYENGNYHVDLYDNGTKIRTSPFDRCIPEFPECIDITITNKCSIGCNYCYLNCNSNGKDCNFNDYYNLLSSIHPYTEVAINGNDLDHPQLENFLEFMKSQNVIVNVTVNQHQYQNCYNILRDYSEKKLIHGIGVSIVPTKTGIINTYNFITYNKPIPNIVYHIIAGLFNEESIDLLINLLNSQDILILGYKDIGRGTDYLEQNVDIIFNNIKLMEDKLDIILNKFHTVCFDNLALKQLNVKDHIGEDKYNESYMGDDGEYTFYLDLVNGIYSNNSYGSHINPHKINSDNITELFQSI